MSRRTVGKHYLIRIPCSVAGEKVVDGLSADVYAHTPEEAVHRMSQALQKAVGWFVSPRALAVPDDKLGARLVKGPANNEENMALRQLTEQQADRLAEANESGDVEAAKKILEEADRRSGL